MTQFDPAQPVYYRNSGKTSLGRLLLALLTILPAVALAGALYAIIDIYLPMLRFAKLVLIIGAALMAGFAFGVGGLTARMLVWARVRNLAMVWAVAGLAAFAAWYVAWVTWEWHLFTQSGDLEISKAELYWGLLTHPRAVWHFATRINAVGTFGIGKGDDMIRGPFLWFLWGIEAAVVLGVASVVPYRMIRGRAFCESCQQWGRVREGVLSVGPAADEDRLRARVALRDLSALEELGPADFTGLRRLRVDLQRCPACDAMHLLSVSRIDVKVDKNGARSEKVRPLIDRLIVGPEQAQEVDAIRQRVYADGPGPAAGVAPGAEPEPDDEGEPSRQPGGDDSARPDERLGA